MEWIAVGRDRENRRRQTSFEAASDEAARAHLEAEGWVEVELLGLYSVGRPERARQHMYEVTGGDPRAVALHERASAEPSKWRRNLLDLVKVYLVLGWKAWALLLAAIVNNTIGGPTWASWALVLLFLYPAFETVNMGRRLQWHQDYRWALAWANWPVAIDRARRLEVVLPELGRCMRARALAGSGQLDAAVALMNEIPVSKELDRAAWLTFMSFVLNEGHDYVGALKVQLDLLDVSEDKASIAQGLVMQYAVLLQDGRAAQPYLELARAARGRGRVADLLLDVAEALVAFEVGQTDGLLGRIEELIEASGREDHPELFGLDSLLHCYTCLLTASSDPTRAADHYRAGAEAVRRRGPRHLLERCERALGVG